jgi:riboflavin-specific deaminase-like protein
MRLFVEGHSQRATGRSHERVTRSTLTEPAAWSVLQAAAGCAARLIETDRPAAFGFGGEDQLRQLPPDHPEALIAWQRAGGWVPLLTAGDPCYALLDLYLPVCSATPARPMTVGHLGQSLDGFIATRSGDSCYVTGEENIRHLHRMRALCDAVVVGAGSVAADDPQLTTRLVPGPNPVRVVLDPTRRLDPGYRVFNDEAATTLYVCAHPLQHPGERRFGRATIVTVGDRDGTIDPAEVRRLLHARGCARIFVEGGGVTVSSFLEADALDRLHVAIAPLIIGEGRPGIRLAPPATLGDCRRPRCRVFRMGADVLFDCDLRAGAGAGPTRSDALDRLT